MMKKTPNSINAHPIYVDMDDILCDTTRHFSAIAAEAFGKKVPFSAITSFNLQESFQLTDGEYALFFERIHQPETLLGFAPVPHALEVLSSWKKMGHTIAVVTGRPAATREISRQWLEAHHVPFDALTMVDKYQRESAGEINPGPAGLPQSPQNPVSPPFMTLDNLKKRRYHFAVEDSWEMAHVLTGTMQVPVALLDKPWNRMPLKNAGITRVKHWQDINDIDFGGLRR